MNCQIDSIQMVIESKEVISETPNPIPPICRFLNHFRYKLQPLLAAEKEEGKEGKEDDACDDECKGVAGLSKGEGNVHPVDARDDGGDVENNGEGRE